MTATVHTCPRCHLRFAQLVELRTHLGSEHATGPVGDDVVLDAARPVRSLTIAADPAHAHPGLVAHGVALALELGLAVDLVAVTPPALASEARAFLQANAAIARSRHATVRTTVLEGGHVAEELDRHLGGAASDLVVVAPRGRHDPGRAFGSTTTALCGAAPVPVVVVGHHVGMAPEPVRRVVACVDGTDAAERTVAVADRLRQRLGVDLHLVEAIRDGGVVPGDLSETNQLRRHASALAVAPTTYDVLHGSDVSRAIERYVGSGRGTLAVLGTHGRTGLARILHGSVSGRVVDHVGCPTVVVPPTVDLGRSLAGEALAHAAAGFELLGSR